MSVAVPVKLDQELFRQASDCAARRGIGLDQLVAEALQRHIEWPKSLLQDALPALAAYAAGQIDHRDCMQRVGLWRHDQLLECLHHAGLQAPTLPWEAVCQQATVMTELMDTHSGDV